MSEVTILLVEDEFLIRAALAECLEDKGLHVLQADSAQAAIFFLKHHCVTLLLTDIHLNNGISGLKLAQQARYINPHIPVIYMSGNAALKTELAVKNERFQAFITKPYEPEDVVLLINRFLLKHTQLTHHNVHS